MSAVNEPAEGAGSVSPTTTALSAPATLSFDPSHIGAVCGVAFATLGSLVVPAFVDSDQGRGFSLIQFPQMIAILGQRPVSTLAGAMFLAATLACIGLMIAGVALSFYGRRGWSRATSFIGSLPLGLFSVYLVLLSLGSEGSEMPIFAATGAYLVAFGCLLVPVALFVRRGDTSVRDFGEPIDWLIAGTALLVVIVAFLASITGIATRA